MEGKEKNDIQHIPFFGGIVRAMLQGCVWVKHYFFENLKCTPNSTDPWLLYIGFSHTVRRGDIRKKLIDYLIEF